MGNAGRNGGEYYTPRPLIRAMIKVLDPKIGERIYDGACGSAGFLCEAFDYLSTQPRPGHDDLKTLQTRTFYGKEKKSLAYVIAIMNMILHGIEAPNVVHANTLAENISDIQDKRPLRRDPGQPALWRQGTQGGPAELPDQDRRDGLPVPAALHQDAEGRRARGHRHQEHLPEQHRQRQREHPQAAAGKLQPAHGAGLPGGTFQGAGVKTVVLFFEKGAPTRKVWFYQLNPGRNMGKTNPLNDDDLAEFVERRRPSPTRRRAGRWTWPASTPHLRPVGQEPERRRRGCAAHAAGHPRRDRGARCRERRSPMIRELVT
jgi:type I restriction enzyme M protein